MNTRTRLNFALLVAVVALAGTLWWLPAPEDNGERERAPLASLDAATVDSVRIESGDQATLVRRAGGGWRIVEPFSAPADRDAIAGIIEALNTPSHAAYPLEGLDPAEYGLEEPSATVTVDGARFAFGRLEPLSRRRYVLHDDRIHLIGNTTYYRLQRPATELVTKRPIPEAADVRTLALPEFSLVRNDRGGWNIHPEQPEAGTDRLQRLADRWRQARAVRVRRDTPGDAEPIGSVRIELAADAPPLTFRAFDNGGKLFLESESGEFVRDMGPDSTGRLLLLPSPAENGPDVPESAANGATDAGG